MQQKENILVILAVIFLVGVIATVVFLLGNSFVSDNVLFLSDLGEMVKESREVAEFSKISLNGCGHIILSQEDQESLKIEAKEKIIKNIKTEVRNNTLYIDYEKSFLKQACSFNTGDISYYLAVKDITEIDINGSGNIRSQATITTDVLSIDIDGSGNVAVPLELTSLKVNIEGSGNFNLSGQADNQDIKIAGSGKYLAGDLISQTVKINIEGSGKVEVNAQQSLDVSIAGSGSVYYLGTPKINQTISGSGKIQGF